MLWSALYLMATVCAAAQPGELALIGYYQQGVCPPDVAVTMNVNHGCFDGGVPSVDCRKYNYACSSTQMKATHLELTTTQGPCYTYAWKWHCTQRAMEHCHNHLWCDPRATCNATVPSCACQGNLTSSGDECVCPSSHYARNVTGQYTCVALTPPCVAPQYEVTAPTETSDRVCLTSLSTTTAVPTVASEKEGWDTWFVLGVVGIVALCLIAIACVAYLCFKKPNRVCVRP